MFETILKLALAEVQKHPERIQEWAAKAVAWYLERQKEREREREELDRLRKLAAAVAKEFKGPGSLSPALEKALADWEVLRT